MIKTMEKLVISIAFTFYSLNSIAEPDEHHQHDVHVHGAAVLNIVAEDETVFIELETPAMNILGFEHAPKTEEQHAVVKQANKQLKSYLSLLSIPNKQCKQTDSDLELAHDTHDNEHHDKEHAGHHDNEQDDSHSEYHLNYIINCESLNNLKLDISLFKNFPGFEHVDLNWIYKQKQGAIELTPDNTLIEF